MRHALIIFVLAALAVVAQQAVQGRIPVWVQGHRLQWVTIGEGLAVVDGELRATGTPTLRLDSLTFPLSTVEQGFQFPTEAAPTLKVYRNGVRQSEGIDYSIEQGMMVRFLHSTVAGDLVILEWLTDHTNG